MKQVNIDLVLIRFFQFILFAVFVFIVIVYFATLMLIPLDLLFQLQRILVFIGIPAMIAVLLTMGAVAYAGYTLWKKPEIWRFLLDVGMSLFNMAVDRVKEMEKMASAAKEQATRSS
ncbi:MAG: hypothetical protein V3V22_04125 [Methylococcales bacterium]